MNAAGKSNVPNYCPRVLTMFLTSKTELAVSQPTALNPDLTDNLKQVWISQQASASPLLKASSSNCEEE